jgi:hypothetical protein
MNGSTANQELLYFNGINGENGDAKLASSLSGELEKIEFGKQANSMPCPACERPTTTHTAMPSLAIQPYVYP